MCIICRAEKVAQLSTARAQLELRVIITLAGRAESAVGSGSGSSSVGKDVSGMWENDESSSRVFLALPAALPSRSLG